MLGNIPILDPPLLQTFSSIIFSSLDLLHTLFILLVILSPFEGQIIMGAIARMSWREAGRLTGRLAGPLIGKPGLSQVGRVLPGRLGLSQGGRASQTEAGPLTGRGGLSQGDRASYR